MSASSDNKPVHRHALMAGWPGQAQSRQVVPEHTGACLRRVWACNRLLARLVLTVRMDGRSCDTATPLFPSLRRGDEVGSAPIGKGG